MNFSLDELQVESYASELSEAELTEVKGGSTPICVAYGSIAVGKVIAAGVTLAAAGIAAWAATRDKTTTTVTYEYDGNSWVKKDSTVTTVDIHYWGN